MAVKCNIAKKVLQKVAIENWGLKRRFDVDRDIIHNYVEHLNCSGISLKICEDYDEECGKLNKANVVDLNCNMNVTNMSYTVVSNGLNDIQFYLSIGDIVGGKAPYTYKWTYNTAHFDLVGNNTSDLLKVKVKAGIKVDLLISPITLEIIDANGCKDTKTCTYTPAGMKCNNNYVPCLGAKGLVVSYNYVTCAKAKNLTVKAI